MADDDSSKSLAQILAGHPAIFVSRTHFTDEELNDYEDALEAAGAKLTYNVSEAGIILSKVTKKARLLFDLRAKGIRIDERLPGDNAIASQPIQGQVQHEVIEIEDDASTASEGDTISSRLKASRSTFKGSHHAPSIADRRQSAHGELVTVVRTDWAQQSIEAGKALSLDDFAILTGYRGLVAVDRNVSPHGDVASHTATTQSQTAAVESQVHSSEHAILERAKEDAGTTSSHPARSLKRKFHGSAAPSISRDSPSWAQGHSHPRYAHLLHATTSEEEFGNSSDLPEQPDWVLKGVKYACQRSTLAGSPNEDFIGLLRKIKLARLLTSDEIGVRAYSTSIAALLAYNYKFVSPREILLLPGCDAKIANLFVEWSNTGLIKAVQDIEVDHDLAVLRLFYNIWGVGSLTAREFFYDRGWRDLDDLVEYNWKGLSRVQQIGVKYYEEFLDPIPRLEVERIGEIVHEHAVRVRNNDIQSVIVGGYRRGKKASGDVDIIISHPDEAETLDIITDIVASLEEEGWITHTLLLSTNNSKRDQQTLPYRGGDMHGSHGFDSLDKALVVWQDPNWLTKAADLAANPNAKNKNIHRRVDIIIAPWRTVGCAVLGWSGGTTFQRDIRRYVRHSFAWKFDSSGVRDRGNGEVLDLEGYHRYEGKLGKGRAKTMVEAEKRVFEGLGLEYREAWERCTD